MGLGFRALGLGFRVDSRRGLVVQGLAKSDKDFTGCHRRFETAVLYIYIYIEIHTYTYLTTNINIYVYVYIYTHIYISLYICIHMYVCVCIYIYIYLFIYMESTLRNLILTVRILRITNPKPQTVLPKLRTGS